ncbi:SIR2 family NAD-dependent protein deacylase [Haliangium sp.]|uniref:SIR2 family NAD-dependent protein deacylase n=1 Tax=Haliangium sp. TaxID=2663208 RepID=UPI003D095B6E
MSTPNELSKSDRDTVAAVAARLARAKSVLFITGAGVSADSGLPTYRGIGGLYNDADTEEGIPIEVALSGMMLESRPEVAWRHVMRIEEACRGARYNRAHEVMAALERHLQRVWVLTQNIDGFHFEAGSRNVIEIHGRLRTLLCTKCDWRDQVADYGGLALPPMCPRCDALIRPDAVFFGEMLPGHAVAELQTQLARGFDMVFSVGTTSVFPYIAAPVIEARRAGRTTIEINPGQTQVSDIVEYRIRAGAAAALEAIWQAMGVEPGPAPTHEEPSA